jgi:circadian clock protein KaiC
MMGNREATETLGPPRLETGVLGLDAVLGGGIPVGRTCMVAGSPGVGKTTLGNQLAFHHAAMGGQALVTTLLAETHDLMLANLRGFRFFDPSLVGDRVHYLNLFDALADEGLHGIITAVRHMARERGATLLIIDGATVIENLAPSQLDLRRFVQQLQAQAAMIGGTTVLLTSDTRDQLEILGAHVDGVLVLTNERVDSRHVRQLEVLKLRGGRLLRARISSRSPMMASRCIRDWSPLSAGAGPRSSLARFSAPACRDSMPCSVAG